MLSRLFRRRNRAPSEPAQHQVIRNPIPIPSSDPHNQLLQVLSRSRPTVNTSSRVSVAVQLVEALRNVEAVTVTRERQHNSSGVGPRRSRSNRTRGDDVENQIHLFVALALRELDLLIDRMSYEELLQAFGDRATTSGMSNEDISRIPARLLSPTEAKVLNTDSITCCICLEPFAAHESIISELPNCCHKFHAACMTTWLKRKSDCPVCRRTVATHATT